VLRDEVEKLMQIPIFASIKPTRLKLLAFGSRRLTFGSEQIICRQGDPADAVFVILLGTAVVVVDTPAGEIKVTDVGETDVVGEIGVLCGVARTATIRTTSAVEVLRIDREQFLSLAAESPEMASQIMCILASRLEETTTELVALRAMALAAQMPN
jgi:CRP-like cAMP-binding protein